MTFTLNPQTLKWEVIGTPTQTIDEIIADESARVQAAIAEWNKANPNAMGEVDPNWLAVQMQGLTAKVNERTAQMDDAAKAKAAEKAAAVAAKVAEAENIYDDKVRKELTEREDKIRAEERIIASAAASAAAKRAAQARLDTLNLEKRNRQAQIDAEKREEVRTIESEGRADTRQLESESRAIDRQDFVAERERARRYEGGMAGYQILNDAAGADTASSLQRIKDQFDPMDKMANEEFLEQLKLLASDFAAARGQVQGAGDDFIKTFVDSIAYKDIPITAYNAPTNPLLDALKSQGASTGEVDAASALASATSQGTSDLAKWAASQLNVGQQNFDAASKNAAMGATAAGLQGLAGQEPRIKAGMQSDLNRRLGDISGQRFNATENVYSREASRRDAANNLLAETKQFELSQAEIQAGIDRAAKSAAEKGAAEKAAAAEAAKKVRLRQESTRTKPLVLRQAKAARKPRVWGTSTHIIGY
jgi:hypothetical protein